MRFGITKATRGQFSVVVTLDNAGNPDGGYAVIGPGMKGISVTSLEDAIDLAETLDSCCMKPQDAIDLEEKLNSFLTRPHDEVLIKYPELKNAFTALSLIEEATSSTPFPENNKLIFKNHAKCKIIKQIATGEPFTLAEKRLKAQYLQELNEPVIEQVKGPEL